MRIFDCWRPVLIGGLLVLGLHTPARGADQPTAGGELAKATFAGGCFWCMEPPFVSLPGVISVTSGYTGGRKANPTYKEVSAGGTGHAEAVEIVYDPARIGYSRLLEIFWRNIDPLDAGGQFCDRGAQYRPAIFHHGGEQKRLAEESRQMLEQSGRLKEPVVVAIEPASTFYPAEDYHQRYARKNPVRYKFYRYSCGRDQRLKAVWGVAQRCESARPIK